MLPAPATMGAVIPVRRNQRLALFADIVVVISSGVVSSATLHLPSAITATPVLSAPIISVYDAITVST